MRPNPTSTVPMYRQLVDQVRHAVSIGALRPGDTLPPAGPVATDLVVSPSTVTRAYRALECEGVVVGARDLEAAADVQRRLLPQDCPAIDGLDYAGLCRPALGVGGDYYDFIRLSDSALAVALADVSGKGTAAALLMATLRGALRGQTLRPHIDLAGIVTNLNQLVYDCSSANRYATFFFSEYDAATRSLTYVNAGHLPPLIVRTGKGRVEIQRLDPTGPVVGMIRESTYTARRVVLAPGDLVVAFTDGVSEAMNSAGEEWGEERLTAAVASRTDLDARALVDRLARDVDAFAAGELQYDDITVVALRVR